MNLDESQKAKVREWIAAGMQPAEIQSRLVEELGVRLTYMEIRFLLADLDLRPQDKEVPADPALLAAKPAAAPAAEPDEEPGVPGRGGRVSLTVDQVTRAGAVVSGRVTFSDGKRAEWYLDQMGRLGLVPAEKGYKPAQSDVMEFQVALQNELAKLGF
jgi:hypothetical protein